MDNKYISFYRVHIWKDKGELQPYEVVEATEQDIDGLRKAEENGEKLFYIVDKQEAKEVFKRNESLIEDNNGS